MHLVSLAAPLMLEKVAVSVECGVACAVERGLLWLLMYGVLGVTFQRDVVKYGVCRHSILICQLGGLGGLSLHYGSKLPL